MMLSILILLAGGLGAYLWSYDPGVYWMSFEESFTVSLRQAGFAWKEITSLGADGRINHIPWYIRYHPSIHHDTTAEKRTSTARSCVELVLGFPTGVRRDIVYKEDADIFCFMYRLNSQVCFVEITSPSGNQQITQEVQQILREEFTHLAVKIIPYSSET
jgi:hypothetical protein